MPSVKKFIKDRAKLKGFFTQIKIQINNERLKLSIFIKKKKIVYTGISLTGKPLEWF